MTLDLDDLADQAVRDTRTRVPAMSEVRAIARRRARRRRGAVGVAAAVSATAVIAGGLWVLGPDDGTSTVTAITDGATDPRGTSSDDPDVPPEPGWPRFVPAPGWDVVQVDSTATAANVPLGPQTRSGAVPWDTVERLEEGDVVLHASSLPVGETSAVDAGFPPGEVPLSIDGAQRSSLEGTPDDVYNESLQAQVNGWNLTVWIFYGGSAEPSAETRAAAQVQLARLEVPPRTVRPLSRAPEDPCEPSGLVARLDLDEAGGALQGRILLRNTGDAPCALEGLPSIELRDATTPNLDVVPTATSEAEPAWQRADADPPEGWPTIRVAAGAEAQAVLTVRNWCSDADEPPFVFTRLPYRVDRVRGDVPPLPALPPCEDPGRPVELAIGPLEPSRPPG